MELDPMNINTPASEPEPLWEDTPEIPPATADPSPEPEPDPQLLAQNEQRAQELAQQFAQERVDDFYRRTYDGQISPYSGKPIASEADFREYEQERQLSELAEKSGVTLEQQRELLRQAMQSDPAYRAAEEKAERLEAIVLKETMTRDLEKIRAHNPKETAKQIGELGETYLNCIRLGMDAVTAYEVARQERQRLNPSPPSMGDLGGTGESGAGYLTEEEVSNWDLEKVHANWERIQESRKHW